VLFWLPEVSGRIASGKKEQTDISQNACAKKGKGLYFLLKGPANSWNREALLGEDYEVRSWRGPLLRREVQSSQESRKILEEKGPSIKEGRTLI